MPLYHRAVPEDVAELRLLARPQHTRELQVPDTDMLLYPAAEVEI